MGLGSLDSWKVMHGDVRLRNLSCKGVHHLYNGLKHAPR
jgi:hypothetical protein